MSSAPDTLVFTGQVQQQIAIGTALVTPTGQAQAKLADALANPSQTTTTTGAIVANATPLPITGLAAAQGGDVSVAGGTSSTSANAGGNVLLTGGTPGATGIGGAVTIAGGAGLGGAAGGAATIIGGAGQGAGAGGAISITSGAAGATGVAGAVAIAVGAATAGNGSSVTVSGGSGAGGTAGGGNVNLVGGAAVSTGTPGEVQINGVPSLSFATYYFTGSPAATAQVFFVATRAMRVKTISEVHSTAAGGASTLTVTKDTGTAGPGAGTVLQTGSFNLNATANTVQVGTVSTTIATVNLAAGDRLAVNFANTIQSSAGIVVTVGMVPI